jgi:hypothetical protein
VSRFTIFPPTVTEAFGVFGFEKELFWCSNEPSDFQRLNLP